MTQPLPERLRRLLLALSPGSGGAEAVQDLLRDPRAELSPRDLGLLTGHPAGLSRRRRSGRLESTFFTSFPEQIALLDADSTVVSVNRAWRQFGTVNGGLPSGYLDASYLAVCARAAADGDGTAAEAATSVRTALRGEPGPEVLYPCHSPDERRWFTVSSLPLPGRENALVVHRDVTAQTEQRLDVERGPLTDPLTGLPNRVLLFDRLSAALRSTGSTTRRVAVLIVDIERDGTVAGSFGAAVRDEMLRQCAARLAEAIQPSDTLGRWADGQFVVVAETAAGVDPLRLAHRLQEALSDPVEVGGQALPLGVTIGLAVSTAQVSAEQLMADARTELGRARQRSAELDRASDGAVVPGGGRPELRTSDSSATDSLTTETLTRDTLTVEPLPNETLPSGEAVVVAARGTLDLATAPQLQSALLDALAAEPALVVADLSDLRLADELAASVFVAVARQALAWPGTRLTLCCPDPPVRAALARLGVPRMLPVAVSREEALAPASTGYVPRRAETSLPTGPTAARAARSFVRQWCEQWEIATLTDVALLVADELVVNAIVHAGGPRRLRAALGRQHLTIAVSDPSPTAPRLEAPDPERESGRGVYLLDRISAGWGVVPEPDGKSTWCALRVDLPSGEDTGTGGLGYGAEETDGPIPADRGQERLGGLLDDVVRRLFGAAFRLNSAASQPAAAAAREPIGRAIDDLDELIRTVQSAAERIRSPDARPGLRMMVLDAVSGATAALGTEPTLQLDGPLDQRVPSSAAEAAVTVVREVLSTVARHAAADPSVVAQPSVTVAVVDPDGEPVLTVQVDDRLVEPAGIDDELLLSADAARRLSGTLSTEADDGGFRLVWSVPLP